MNVKLARVICVGVAAFLRWLTTPSERRFIDHEKLRKQRARRDAEKLLNHK